MTDPTPTVLTDNPQPPPILLQEYNKIFSIESANSGLPPLADPQLQEKVATILNFGPSVLNEFAPNSEGRKRFAGDLLQTVLGVVKLYCVTVVPKPESQQQAQQQQESGPGGGIDANGVIVPFEQKLDFFRACFLVLSLTFSVEISGQYEAPITDYGVQVVVQAESEQIIPTVGEYILASLGDDFDKILKKFALNAENDLNQTTNDQQQSDSNTTIFSKRQTLAQAMWRLLGTCLGGFHKISSDVLLEMFFDENMSNSDPQNSNSNSLHLLYYPIALSKVLIPLEPSISISVSGLWASTEKNVEIATRGSINNPNQETGGLDDLYRYKLELAQQFTQQDLLGTLIDSLLNNLNIWQSEPEVYQFWQSLGTQSQPGGPSADLSQVILGSGSQAGLFSRINLPLNIRIAAWNTVYLMKSICRSVVEMTNIGIESNEIFSDKVQPNVEQQQQFKQITTIVAQYAQQQASRFLTEILLHQFVFAQGTGFPSVPDAGNSGGPGRPLPGPFVICEAKIRMLLITSGCRQDCINREGSRILKGILDTLLHFKWVDCTQMETQQQNSSSEQQSQQILPQIIPQLAIEQFKSLNNLESLKQNLPPNSSTRSPATLCQIVLLSLDITALTINSTNEFGNSGDILDPESGSVSTGNDLYEHIFRIGTECIKYYHNPDTSNSFVTSSCSMISSLPRDTTIYLRQAKRYLADKWFKPELRTGPGSDLANTFNSKQYTFWKNFSPKPVVGEKGTVMNLDNTILQFTNRRTSQGPEEPEAVRPPPPSPKYVNGTGSAANDSEKILTEEYKTWLKNEALFWDCKEWEVEEWYEFGDGDWFDWYDDEGEDGEGGGGRFEGEDDVDWWEDW